MHPQISYSKRERSILWIIAGIGFVGINGAFLYGLLFCPGAIPEVMTNPISAAFMVETFLLLGMLAYLFTKWSVANLSWKWFLALSLLGSMAFAIPVILLFPSKE